MFKKFNRNTSIKKRIFIGFSGAIAGIILVSMVTIYGLGKVESNYIKLETLNNEVNSIIELSNLASELKRNVSIYIYTGQESVVRKVYKILKEVTNQLDNKSIEKSDLFNRRMQEHLNVYSSTFELVIKEYSLKKRLTDIELPAILSQLKRVLPEKEVSKIESTIWSYRSSPDGKKSREVIKSIKALSGPTNKNLITKIEKIFLRLTQATRSYLYLVNVVMAGEALEFEYVSQKMKSRALKLKVVIKNKITSQNKIIRNTLVFFLILFFVIMSFYSWIVSVGISKPLIAITKTLDKITSGKTDIHIPEQDREDEIGTLSRAAETFRERSDRLERSNNELSQFAYRTSHDLRAPLLSILGITDIIKDDINDKDYDEVKSNLDKITSSATKLNSLITDILNLSKADNVDEEIEYCDLTDIIKSIQVKLGQMLIDSNVVLGQKNPNNITIMSQKTRLEQVLENLITNSIKYSDPSKSDSYVDISLSEDSDSIKITIKDNGLGIEKKYHDSLFGMFKRFHTNVSFGSGLGLYLVKKHIDIMNGTILVTSEKGLGSTFIITLPKK